MKGKIMLATIIVVVSFIFLVGTVSASDNKVIKIKVFGGEIGPTEPDSYLDERALWSRPMTQEYPNFYLNGIMLISKTLEDNGTTLLLTLQTDNSYVLTREAIDVSYWIYFYNLTYSWNFSIDSIGKLNSIEGGSTRYVSNTDTLYIGLPPLLGVQSPQISWIRVAVFVGIGSMFVVIPVAIYFIRKKVKK